MGYVGVVTDAAESPRHRYCSRHLYCFLLEALAILFGCRSLGVAPLQRGDCHRVATPPIYPDKHESTERAVSTPPSDGQSPIKRTVHANHCPRCSSFSCHHAPDVYNKQLGFHDRAPELLTEVDTRPSAVCSMDLLLIID